MVECDICGAQTPDHQKLTDALLERNNHLLEHIIERLENIEELFGFEGAKARVKDLRKGAE